MLNRADHYNMLMKHLTASTEATFEFIRKGYDNDLFDPWVISVGWCWIQKHRKVYQAGLVDYYIAMANIHVKEEDQPMYNDLMKIIDAFVEFLNQEVPENYSSIQNKQSILLL